MATANVYLTFNGNCEDAFNFYRSVLGGEFIYMGRFKDMPPSEGSKPMPAEDLEKIMHVSLPVSKETMLMGSDTGGEWAASFIQGNNFSISLKVDSIEEADRLFNKQRSSSRQATKKKAKSKKTLTHGLGKLALLFVK